MLHVRCSFHGVLGSLFSIFPLIGRSGAIAWQASTIDQPFERVSVSTVGSPKSATPQERESMLSRQFVQSMIEREVAEFAIRNRLNLLSAEDPATENWPQWEDQGDFYRSRIFPYLEERFAAVEIAPDNSHFKILFGQQPIVLARVSTEEQEMTLSEVHLNLGSRPETLLRKLFQYEIMSPIKLGKKVTYQSSVSPTVFKVTTGAKVVKTISPWGRKQRIVAYTQPGVYTPVYESKLRVSQDFPGAVLRHYVYFNQGDALHKTIGNERDLGRKDIIGTMEASGGCVRLGAKEAQVAHSQITRVGLRNSRVQVMETNDILDCRTLQGDNFSFAISADRTSGVLLHEPSKKPIFVGLRGDTRWKVDPKIGRQILLSSLPKLLEGEGSQPLPRLEVNYALLTDKNPFRSFGESYSVMIERRIFEVRARRDFVLADLLNYVTRQEDVAESQLTLDCARSIVPRAD